MSSGSRSEGKRQQYGKHGGADRRRWDNRWPSLPLTTRRPIPSPLFLILFPFRYLPSFSFCFTSPSLLAIDPSIYVYTRTSNQFESCDYLTAQPPNRPTAPSHKCSNRPIFGSIVFSKFMITERYASTFLLWCFL